MSKTTQAMLVKFLATLVASAIAFAPWGWSWVIGLAILGTALNYIIGDLILLPLIGSLAASIADWGIAMVTAYLLGAMSRTFNPTFYSLVTFGVIIAMTEYFFHKFLIHSKKVAP